MFTVEGRKFSVLGLARTGIASANYLARHGADVLASDPKALDALPTHQLDPTIKVTAERNEVRAGDIVIISPGIRPDSQTWAVAHEMGSEVWSDVELFYRLSPAPIIAITGTDGKSTTTALIGELLKSAGLQTYVGGNIGWGCMDGLDALNSESVAVLEVSCFQLSHCIDFRPKVAVMTNIAEDHLDYYGGLEPYIEAKKRVFRNMGTGDRLVLNDDDPVVSKFEAPQGVQTLRFGWGRRLEAWCDRNAVHLRLGDFDALVPLDELKLQGLHNAENVMSALLATLGTFVHLQQVYPALCRFPGLEHRMEYVAEIDGRTYFNDTKATNPHAASAALNAFDDAFVLLAGGYEKGSDFKDFGQLIARKTREVVLFGDTRHRIRKTIPDGHPVTMVETLEEAVPAAHRVARCGERVILAPACASFDEFKDYEARGRAFKDWVRALAHEAKGEV